MSEVQAAEAARDKAILQVEQGVNSDWWKMAMKCVKAACVNREEFTTDLVHAIMAQVALPEATEKRVFGALMKRAHKLGWCYPTERMVKSKRKDAHRRPITVWRSKLK